MAAKPKNPVHVVSNTHAQQFGAAVVFWADVLALNDWRIVVSETRSRRKVMAEVFKCDLEQRSASIRLGHDFGPMPVTERSLSELALHEVLHIFLTEFKSVVLANVTQDDILSAEHRIINVLERVLSNASPLGPAP